MNAWPRITPVTRTTFRLSRYALRTRAGRGAPTRSTATGSVGGCPEGIGTFVPTLRPYAAAHEPGQGQTTPVRGRADEGLCALGRRSAAVYREGVVSRERAPSPVASAGPGPSAGRWTYLDNLKVLLIAAIIAMHAVLSYSTVEVWTYTAMREVTLNPVVEAVLFVAVIPFGLFLIALLFLVAGLLTPPSVQRKGPGGFARDRLLRLGVPFAVYVLILQPIDRVPLGAPVGGGAGNLLAGVPRRRACSGHRPAVVRRGAARVLPGLCRVGARAGGPPTQTGWGRRHRGTPAAGRGRGRTGVVPDPADLPLRRGGRLHRPEPVAVAGMHRGVRPGNRGSRQGWLSAVPGHLHRQCRTATLLAVVAMAVLLVLVGLGGDIEDMVGGWTWAALGFAVIESVLNLFGSVWLLGLAQRHLTGSTGGVQP